MLNARLIPLLMFVPAVAAAQVPSRLAYQGRLMNADGEPMRGRVSITFAFYSAQNGGSPLWTETQTLGLTDGFYAVMLGSESALDPTVFSGGTRYLEVSVNGAVLTSRQEVGSVAHAFLARGVSGGVVDASEVRVNGKTVIDSAGAVTAGVMGGVVDAREIRVSGKTVIDSSGAVTGAVKGGIVDASEVRVNGKTVIDSAGAVTAGVIGGVVDASEIRVSGKTVIDSSGAVTGAVKGGIVDASEVRVNGKTVIDSAGAVKGPSGVTYTRWGRTTCPAESSVVYTGYAAGSSYSHGGSGSNTLCLIDNPKWDDIIQGISDVNNDGALLYGTEFETGGYGVAPLKGFQDYDARCVVCEAPANLVLMIPGTTKCPASWARQYFGYLMATHYKQAKSEFVCVDAAPEQAGSQTDSNGNLWYPTETECGSLPCPPYVQDREVACVVCTK